MERLEKVAVIVVSFGRKKGLSFNTGNSPLRNSALCKNVESTKC